MNKIKLLNEKDSMTERYRIVIRQSIEKMPIKEKIQNWKQVYSIGNL